MDSVKFCAILLNSNAEEFISCMVASCSSIDPDTVCEFAELSFAICDSSSTEAATSSEFADNSCEIAETC